MFNFSFFKTHRDVIVKRVQLLNLYCLNLLTYHSKNDFKRDNYFPELVAHMPAFYQQFVDMFTSKYVQTRYLSKSDSLHYRLFFSDNKVFRVSSILGQMALHLSTESEKQMVVLSCDGELFSAEKRDDLQHSSFTRGGYVIFAGYWCVNEGTITEVVAESGHYEPTIVSLQNFCNFLTYFGIDVTDTTFVSVTRGKDSTGIYRNERLFSFEELMVDSEISEECPDGCWKSFRDLKLIPATCFEKKRRDALLKAY